MARTKVCNYDSRDDVFSDNLVITGGVKYLEKIIEIGVLSDFFHRKWCAGGSTSIGEVLYSRSKIACKRSCEKELTSRH